MSASFEKPRFESPDDGKFEVGEVYYELYSDFCVRGKKAVPAVRMWIFDGCFDSLCSPDRVSRAFSFSPYNDGWTDDWVPSVESKSIYLEEDLWMIEKSYLTWEEFTKAVAGFEP